MTFQRLTLRLSKSRSRLESVLDPCDFAADPPFTSDSYDIEAHAFTPKPCLRKIAFGKLD